MPARTTPLLRTPAAADHLPDVRTYWRVVLALVAPLPMVAKGLYYLITPVDGGAGFHDSVAAYAARPGLLGPLMALDAVFVVTLVPATLAVGLAARRGAPRLSAAGTSVALLGFLAGTALLGGVLTPASLTARHHLDVEAMAALDATLATEPLLEAAGLLFIIGVVVGLGLLGAALWRSRIVPPWVGAALLVGASTHPFVPGHVSQGIGLLVAAVGFTGAGVALLRLSNDELDLPALRTGR